MDHVNLNGFQTQINGCFHDFHYSSLRNVGQLPRMNLQEMNLIPQLCC